MQTSVIVINYRTPEMLERFIASYCATAYDTQLIVVDVMPQRPLSDVPGRYLIMKENNGYAAACNHAATWAVGDVLAFFNADVQLLPGTIDKTSTALLTNNDWGVAGPLQYSSAGSVTHAGIFGTLDHPRHRAWQQPVADEFRDVQEAVTVSGSAYFVKRACWTDLMMCPTWRSMYPDIEGAFLPTFLYYEETFLSYHAISHDWKVMYYGLAECIHEWHDTISRYGDRSCVRDSRDEFRKACDTHGIAHD